MSLLRKGAIARRVGAIHLLDFLKFTELDPYGQIAVSAHLINFRTTKTAYAYVYKDFGVDHFQNFVHYVDIRSDFNDTSVGVVWMLANNIANWESIRTTGKTSLAVRMYRNGAPYYVDFCETYNKVLYPQTWKANPSPIPNTWYYLKIVKQGTSVFCYIYSDKAHSILVTSLYFTLRADHKFRYLFACNTVNDGFLPTRYMNNDIANLVV